MVPELELICKGVSEYREKGIKELELGRTELGRVVRGRRWQ